MFAMRSSVELGKAIAKFGVVAVVAAIVLWNDAPALMALGQRAVGASNRPRGPTERQRAAGDRTAALIAGVDGRIELWQYAKQMRMSREEIAREYKEAEGSPESRAASADAAADGAPAHDAGSAEGRRGRHEPDALRGRTEVRREAHARADRGREGCRCHRGEDPRSRSRARRAESRSAAARSVLYRHVEIGDEIPSNCMSRSRRS